jgi:hypothetical protein
VDAMFGAIRPILGWVPFVGHGPLYAQTYTDAMARQRI